MQSAICKIKGYHDSASAFCILYLHDKGVLVMQDMLGITKGFSPRFLRRYADLNTVITEAVQNYISDVKSCDFPSEKEQY